MRNIQFVHELISKLIGVFKGNPWHYQAGKDVVPISQIISPLRLDILIRKNFLEFCADYLDLYSSDFDQFIRLARDHPYYLWYEKIACARYSPPYRRYKRIDGSFQNRVRLTVELYLNYLENGYRPNPQIILYSGLSINPTATGKKVGRKYFAGDGCHRIALLSLSGCKYLMPDQYKIRKFKKLSPLDNTHLLIQHMSITEAEYYSFISSGYCDKQFSNKEFLISEVETNYPEFFLEIKRLTSRDAPFLRKDIHA